MKKGDVMMKDDELDALFAAARDDTPAAPADFMARVLGDAADVAAETASGAASTRTVTQAPGLLAILGEMLGGWRGGMALTASALIGVWIGVADPGGVDSVSGLVGALSGEAVLAEDEGSMFYDLLSEG